MEVKLDYKKLKKRLEAERERSVEHQKNTIKERKPVELDQAKQGRLSRMDAMQLQEMAVEQDRRRQIKLARIDAALLRIERGEFGCCVRCGDLIEFKRLDIDPSIPSCYQCARS